MDSRIEQILGRAAIVLADQGRHQAADFLKAVLTADTHRFHTVGEYGEHVINTDGLSLFVPPTRMAEWVSVRSDVTEAVEQASGVVAGAWITEVFAYPVIAPYRRSWRDEVHARASADTPTTAKRPMNADTRALVGRLIVAHERGPQHYAVVLAEIDLLPPWERAKVERVTAIIFGTHDDSGQPP